MIIRNKEWKSYMEAVALADRLDKIGTKRANQLAKKAWDRAVYRMGIYNEIAQQGQSSRPPISCDCPFSFKFVDGKYFVCRNCGSRTRIEGG